jgi:hypothetical protein
LAALLDNRQILFFGQFLVAVLVGADQKLLDPFGGAGGHFIGRNHPVVVGIEALEHHLGVEGAGLRRFAGRCELRHDEEGHGRRQRS